METNREFPKEKSPTTQGQNQDPVYLPVQYVMALFIQGAVICTVEGEGFICPACLGSCLWLSLNV